MLCCVLGWVESLVWKLELKWIANGFATVFLLVQ